MKKELAGVTFVYNAIKMDYCIKECIESLDYVCDHVIIVDAGSTDGTFDYLKSFHNDKRHTLIGCHNEMWQEKKGREKLSYFTNIGIKAAQELGYEYVFNCQADEVVSENSIDAIWDAVKLGEEAYLVTRHNLWGSPYTMLNVKQDRKPVNTQVCRLAKSNYWSIDDAESIYAPASFDFINKIEIFHMGFVRDKKKHLEKIKHIQDEIFLVQHDKRIDSMIEFDPWGMGFDKNDVIPISGQLPSFIKKWAEDRE